MQGNNHTRILLLLLQVISLWINALLNYVIIIIIKLAHMASCCHTAYPRDPANSMPERRRAGLFGAIRGWKKTVTDL
jgi:hypothetical protein